MRLVEAESPQLAEPVFPDEVENEGEAKEDDADRYALQTYINTLQAHNSADSDSDSEAELRCQENPSACDIVDHKRGA
ncbi:hypothetical protein FN846DRAFT_907109 [Sphaerosporella brunnea]|uniref:Uncharacterized protein n=1 Tax=Sphaerosporella brunnea TaxID=1250544 RepID=A0A5J5EY58_9PEZI|nr:hypothetical protein FN846DRAFT_907109 [Sphaerosporella brunnea]